MDGVGNNSWEMRNNESRAGGGEDSGYSRNDLL